MLMLVVTTAAILLLAVIIIATVVMSAVRVERERQRVASEARLAEWQLSHIAHLAMQRLLDEARAGLANQRS